ncbi:MAG: hypothetical protein DPW18_19795, partial [Chloroflexi bacterium]|nr:hypothetical protein [Chloroflexota bacterium]MDL1941235.1 hypothetical protein [Chloroflexi bacterium CFX2]
VLTTNIGSTTTYFVGAHYEVVETNTGTQVNKYYFFGAQRIAIPQGDDVRKNGELFYLLSDHLGSTSIVTDASGNVVSQTKYKAWGEVRHQSGVSPTEYQYTSQYSYAADFGLLYYNARWYDPSLNRFAQADTIVPPGVQGLDRYAYVNNSPMNYVDPSGHFTEEAIDKYLTRYCNGLRHQMDDCGAQMKAIWQADKEWWGMISTAEGGDTLMIGICENETCGAPRDISATFGGEGKNFISININLIDIQRGYKGGGRSKKNYEWFGFVRLDEKGTPSFYIRDSYSFTTRQTPQWESGLLITATDALLIPLGVLSAWMEFVFLGHAAIDNMYNVGIGSLFTDMVNMQTGDVQVRIIGPQGTDLYLNFQYQGGSWILEPNSSTYNPYTLWK